MIRCFYSNGKLLLSGEYAVLDGALSLAIPTSYGQSLEIEAIEPKLLKWCSLDHNGEPWFESQFNLKDLAGSENNAEIKNRLSKILQAAKTLNPEFLNNDSGYSARSTLDFPKNWGLGSSSTLINNIATWAKVDPYTLLSETFGGSGYDIACAGHNVPLLFQLHNDSPKVTEINFDPPFKDRLFFIYLNKKQDSREGIAKYRNQNFNKNELIKKVSEITEKMVKCTDLLSFEKLIEDHESLISKAISIPPVKSSHFPDYPGAIKSLGAWGGDFVLATAADLAVDYFKGRGYHTVIPYQKMLAD